jgi:hypothetical protein
MKKKKEEGPRNAADRLDHHEKILGLLADRLNNEVIPLLRRNEKAIEKNRQAIESIVEWIDRGVWGRMWDWLKQDVSPW